jgi:hypothetical protein
LEVIAASKESPKEFRLSDVSAYLKAYRKAIKIIDLCEKLKKRTMFTKNMTQQALLTVLGFPPSPAFLQLFSSQPDAIQSSPPEFIEANNVCFKLYKKDGAFWVEFLDPKTLKEANGATAIPSIQSIPMSQNSQTYQQVHSTGKSNGVVTIPAQSGAFDMAAPVVAPVDGGNQQKSGAMISDDTFIPWEAPKDARPVQVVFVDMNSREYMGHSDPSKFLKLATKKINLNPDAKRIIVTDPILQGKGFDMLRRMGWRFGEGLGKRRQGLAEPVPVWFMTGRTGLHVTSSTPD